MSGKSGEGFDAAREEVERYERERKTNERFDLGDDEEQEEKEDLFDTSELRRDDPSMRVSGDFHGDDSFGMATANIQQYLRERGIDEDADEKADLDETQEHKAGDRVDESAQPIRPANEKALKPAREGAGAVPAEAAASGPVPMVMPTETPTPARTESTRVASAASAATKKATTADSTGGNIETPAVGGIAVTKPQIGTPASKAGDGDVSGKAPASASQPSIAAPEVDVDTENPAAVPSKPAEGATDLKIEGSAAAPGTGRSATSTAVEGGQTAEQPATSTSRRGSAAGSTAPAAAATATAASTTKAATTASVPTIASGATPATTGTYESKPDAKAATKPVEPRKALLNKTPATTDTTAKTGRFKRNREAAEATGQVGGELALGPMPKEELSVRLQAIWRGKQDRRKLKKHQVCAVSIQRFVRGLLVRDKAGSELKRHRERIETEQVRKSRLAHIRSKEKDLALLSTIPAEQYVEFERLRRENGARAIQRNWRAVQHHRTEVRLALEEAKLDDWLGDDQLLGTRAATTTADVRKFPRAFLGKAGKPLYRGAAATRFQGISQTYVTSTAASEERALQEQRQKLQQHMLRAVSEAVDEQKRDELFAKYKAMQASSTASAETPAFSSRSEEGQEQQHGWKKYNVEVEALGLAQLQRRVREQAHTRARQQEVRAARKGFRPTTTTPGAAASRSGVDLSQSYEATRRVERDGTGGAPRWGARRNYQDLMEAQVQANVLLHEHQYALPHISARQAERHKVLGNCQHLLKELQQPLSLEEARTFIREQAAAKVTPPGAPPAASALGAEVQERAAAWLVDEDLWRAPAGQTEPSQGAAASPYVSAAAVEAATAQHINALHALRTSNISYGQSGAHNARRKHWGAVALPLPLHVVTAPAAATGGVTVDEVVRASGEWKGLRGSFNRSVDGELAKEAAATAGETKKTGLMNADTLSQRLLTDAKLFRPLASQWAKGTDVEDSLYWIAYATQPSNIVPGPVAPSPFESPAKDQAKETNTAAGDTAAAAATVTPAGSTAANVGPYKLRPEHEELRRRIAVEAMGLTHRVTRVRKQVEHEQERISRLAEVFQGEMFAYLRREHALSAQHLLSGERAQQQHRAAAKIQALARGASTRTRVAALRAQRRVMLALQNLLHEIAASEGGAPPPPLPTVYHPHQARAQNQPGAQRGPAVFNNLLSNLAGMTGLPGAAVGSGHSAASLSRASSSTLAGLAISSQTSGAGPSQMQVQRMQSTHMSALTSTPGAYTGTATASHTVSTPISGGGRVSYAAGLPDSTTYAAPAAGPSGMAIPHPPHSAHRSLVSNVSHMHVNVHQNTPSYFSPMVTAPTGTEPASARTYGGEAKGNYEYKDAKDTPYGSAGYGIASTPSARPMVPASSVVNRGAWNSDLGGSKRGVGTGMAVDPTTGAVSMGHSSPSKQTFNILTASYTAGEQVPEESLQLSASLTSQEYSGLSGSARSPGRGQGRHDAGVASPSRPGVTFSLELPQSTFPHDHPESPRGMGVDSTPQRSGRKGSTAPDTPGSMALSEYSYMHEDDLHPGAAFISSPGHSASGGDHSLSRSLSASFGQVSGALPSDTAEVKEHRGGRDEGKGATPRSPSRGPTSPHSPKSPVSARRGTFAGGGVSGGRAGTLSPELMQRFAQAAAGGDSDDSVEGLEIPYNQSPSAKSPGPASVKGFRIHGTAKAAQIAQQAAVAVRDAMSIVEQRFRSGTCTVGPFINSALAADVRNFDKAAALSLLQNMAMITGVPPLVRWLQRFRFDPQQPGVTDSISGQVSASASASLVLGSGELPVGDAALLIAELATELRLMDVTAPDGGKSVQEREKQMLFSLIQTCVLMKLLGACTDSGRLKIAELSALLEDAWVRTVPINGVRVSLLLAQLRYCLLQQASRKASHPRKLFDDIVAAAAVTMVTRANKPNPAQDQWYDEERLSSASVAQVFARIYATSPNYAHLAVDEGLCVELAQALVRFNGWSDVEDYITVSELRNALCCLCPFRVLQKRLQTWFRAVPNMHPSLLKNVAAFLNADKVSNGMVSTPVFIQACEASHLPLSQSECYMLAQLLTRRRQLPPTSRGQPGPTEVFVDVALLQRIKTGDFLHAALA